MFSFTDKVVWVTGSSTGIGSSIAKAFAEAGAKLVVHGNSNVDAAKETLSAVQASGAEALLVTGDVTKPLHIQEMVEQINARFGRLDVLVNNAGTMVKRSKIEDLDHDTWNNIFDINVSSVFHVTKAALPLLKKSANGNIINITSIAARNGGGGGAVAYASAKGAVSTLTRGLAKELLEYNIRVNGIAPGVIETPFHERYSSQELMDKMTAQIPLGRTGTPDDIAGVALFLASDYSSYLVGEIVEANGGMLMD
ncbi:glucose 1-dehydrogenase [Psychrobacillus sp. FSL K6-4046]|uniref:SDR family NAD(P)-dependent oxidoreductase n=1 Tax=Psychrobacillus sp. FSL K6-4046 TaxID=2921550 RepID=UPI00315B26B8